MYRINFRRIFSSFVRSMFFTSCLYYKHIMIVNDDSRVIRMMLQVVASPTIIIENIYSIGITHDNGNMFIVQAWLNEVGQTWELISECTGANIGFLLWSWNNKRYNEFKVTVFYLRNPSPFPTQEVGYFR